DYWQTVAVTAVGGLLGVIFTIPLRRALIITARLKFPEGVATAEVLKVGAGEIAVAATGFRTLLTAACLGGAVKFAESGLRLWKDVAEGIWSMGRPVMYGGLNLSPALLGVGFIIGLNTAVVVFLGGALAWWVLLPAYGVFKGWPDGQSGMAAVQQVWSAKIRYVGIGAMLIGGLWTLIQIRKPILDSLHQLTMAYRRQGVRAQVAHKSGQPSAVARTEQDASLSWIILPLLFTLILMIFIYHHVVDRFVVAAGMALVMVIAAFLFSSVAANMAGLVGSSSNPVSGVTIATIMLASVLLVLVMGHGHPAGPAAALLIGAVVCCAAAMGGDNLQDLKTGHLVGATPWKQQIMQVVGVATGAVVIAPVLSLLDAKYGIGEVTADHPHSLSAPQATLMANLSRAVFGEGLPWDFVGLGVAIGLLTIALDSRQAARGAAFRIPVLAVALGIYLPLKLSAAITVGGAIAELARRRHSMEEQPVQQGLLFAAGLITGEALMGILLAFPIALSGVWTAISADPFQVFDTPPLGAWPGLFFLGVVATLLYWMAVQGKAGIRE
ncbi:MAG: OPT family oligopeptide transporter, partial [Nitrospiraceae bacterium]